jgi:hypothetical protein
MYQKRVFAGFFVFFLAIAGVLPLFAGAAADEVAINNSTWVFCVTAPNTAELAPEALPASLESSVDIASRELVRQLLQINKRRRLSGEELYYRENILLAGEKAAAKAIVAKQESRDTLVFQGLPERKFKSQIKKIDGELVTLREKLDDEEQKYIVIEWEPSIILTDANKTYSFPMAPAAGGELSFCVSQKADAFLSWTMTNFFGRIDLKLRIWAIFARNWVYEDEIIFSPEDTDAAIKSISVGLVEFFSGENAAAIIVKAQPSNAIISVDGVMQGMGTTELIEREPGMVFVEVSAPYHESYFEAVTLSPDTGTELSITLPEIPQGETHVTSVEKGTGNSNAALHSGVLYLGQSPFILTAPLGSKVILSAETAKGYSDYSVLSVGKKKDEVLKPIAPMLDGTVDRARRGFYGAYGRFWITLPLAMVVTAMYNSQKSALLSSSSFTREQYDTNQAYFFASGAAWGLTAAFAAESVARLVFYIAKANTEPSPMLKKSKESSDSPKKDSFWDIIKFGTLK